MLIIPEIISQTFSKPRAMNLYSNRSWVMTNHNARNIRHMVETLIDHSFRPISAQLAQNYYSYRLQVSLTSNSLFKQFMYFIFWDIKNAKMPLEWKTAQFPTVKSLRHRFILIHGLIIVLTWQDFICSTSRMREQEAGLPNYQTMPHSGYRLI